MKPLFSIVVPAHTEEFDTARTLANLIYQMGPKVPREIIIVSDGPRPEMRRVVQFAKQKLAEEDQPVTIRYAETKEQTGTGNIGRDLGLRKATGEWVMFIDSGTAVLNTMFGMLKLAVEEKPDAQIILWDIIQQLDPAPFAHFCILAEPFFNDESIGYFVPGVGAAIRRTIGQQEQWPNVGPSDWAYWSRIWKRLDKPVRAALIKYPMVIAYSASEKKRYRRSRPDSEYRNWGYYLPYDEAIKNGQPVSRAADVPAAATGQTQ